MLHLSILSVVIAAADAPALPPIEPIPFTAVRITDAFWAPRIETNRAKTLPHNIKTCESTGRVANFAIAGGLEEGKFQGNSTQEVQSLERLGP
jgi:hypothetical protein